MTTIISGNLNSRADIGISYLKEDNQRLAEIILSQGDEQDRSTNIKADMTSARLTSKFPELNLFVEGIVRDGIIPYLGKRNSTQVYNAFQDAKEQSYSVFDIWGAVYNKGDYTISHDHIWSSVSFCYYVSVPKNCSPLVFDDINISIQPEEGMLVVFHSELKHSVPVSISEEPRIVIAGNVMVNPPCLNVTATI